jgi:hypothetical protein
METHISNLSVNSLRINKMLFFSTVRIIYLIMLPNGVFEVAPGADVFFSELPALLFFFIYSLIVVRW